MRKMIVEVCLKDPLMGRPPDTAFLNWMVKDLLDRIESVKVLELLKVNFERGEETVVAEITMKVGCTANDLEFPESLGSLEVLKVDGRTYTCFLRIVIRDEFLLEKMREFDLDIIWTLPIYKSRDLHIYTCIGDAENLNKVLRLLSTYGEVRNVIFEEATFSENGPLSALTRRQRDLLLAAKRYGYYEYPRKITSQQLAEKLGISKTTAIEHLRRGEARLISMLLAGY
ncbi:helix-turn-helix domain-containing protein [Methanoculleus sp.]|uniref:helix-turn-helix domain-containing protein n=2 Tax=Methanoculleus sp. TaxID=90427 RepID=UPI0025E7469B|nr:helix-turn-helix domain-containing protein [Methanoculleus sp.]